MGWQYATPVGSGNDTSQAHVSWWIRWDDDASTLLLASGYLFAKACLVPQCNFCGEYSRNSWRETPGVLLQHYARVYSASPQNNPFNRRIGGAPGSTTCHLIRIRTRNSLIREVLLRVDHSEILDELDKLFTHFLLHGAESQDCDVYSVYSKGREETLKCLVDVLPRGLETDSHTEDRYRELLISWSRLVGLKLITSEGAISGIVTGEGVQGCIHEFIFEFCSWTAWLLTGQVGSVTHHSWTGNWGPLPLFFLILSGRWSVSRTMVIAWMISANREALRF